MSKLACTFLLFSLLQVVVPTATRSQGNAPPSGFSGPTVLVKYVAGTQKLGGLGQIGCLKWSRSDSKSDSLFFFAYPHPGRPVRAAGFLAHLIDPSWVKGGRFCRKADPKAPEGSGEPYLPIPLEKDHLRGLARGQVQTMGQSGAGAVETLGTVFGAGGAVAAVTSGKLSEGQQIGVSIVGGTVAAVALGAYLNRRTQNYITIFYNKDPATEPELTAKPKAITERPSPTDEKTSNEATPQATNTPSAPSLFPKCKDFAVFQIIDPHDYWNTSMFLNAMTGLTFVDESTTQGGKGAAAPTLK